MYGARLTRQPRAAMANDRGSWERLAGVTEKIRVRGKRKGGRSDAPVGAAEFDKRLCGGMSGRRAV
jgi:hypothetical protein